jgi:predicted ATP-dependent protease
LGVEAAQQYVPTVSGILGHQDIPGLAVGGIKMKVLAAYRAGLTTVILPKRNERDLDELPDEVRTEMTFMPAERIEQALEVALIPIETRTETPEERNPHVEHIQPIRPIAH